MTPEAAAAQRDAIVAGRARRAAERVAARDRRRVQAESDRVADQPNAEEVACRRAESAALLDGPLPPGWRDRLRRRHPHLRRRGRHTAQRRRAGEGGRA